MKTIAPRDTWTWNELKIFYSFQLASSRRNIHTNPSTLNSCCYKVMLLKNPKIEQGKYHHYKVSTVLEISSWKLNCNLNRECRNSFLASIHHSFIELDNLINKSQYSLVLCYVKFWEQRNLIFAAYFFHLPVLHSSRI